MALQWVLLATQFGRQALHRERIFAERTTALEIYDDLALIRKFRFPRATILDIIDLCKPYLTRKTHRNHSLPVSTQVLAALRFYAKGSFQEDFGDIVGVSQASASKIVNNVTNILISKRADYIKFPTTPQEILGIKMGFASLAGFPHVLGAIDGTHIFMQPPSGPEEPLYVCRKGGHSINVQVICDREMQFTSIVAKFPGTTHDSFIWRNCHLRDQYVHAPPNGWLLGDSGYGTEPWLIPPLKEPLTLKERNFNHSLRKTRYIVENSIGLWKSVFRCIDKSGGKLLYSPTKVCKIVTATAVLHNMRRKLHLPEDEQFYIEAEEDYQKPDSNMSENTITIAGNRTRNLIIQTHF